MSHDPTAVPNGPWRLLVLDPDLTDPKLILATVAAPADVEPAWPAAGLPALQAAAEWATARTGQPVTLTAITGAQVWRLDPDGRQQS